MTHRTAPHILLERLERYHDPFLDDMPPTLADVTSEIMRQRFLTKFALSKCHGRVGFCSRQFIPIEVASLINTTRGFQCWTLQEMHYKPHEQPLRTSYPRNTFRFEAGDKW